MAGVKLGEVRKDYAGFTVVEPTSLDIREGEMLALLGPSGCGKTTTLRMIAGFVAPSAGTIHLGLRDVTRVPVHKRNVGMVFQGYALLPHLTVARNIEFGMRVRGWQKARMARRLEEMLRWVRLEALADRFPKALSGGQQQRVALARAMAVEPAVLLLDEPFSALDAKLRVQMRGELRELQRQAGITAVFVTHDQEEAMAMADRIAVMNHGRIEQIGSARDLYERPASRFVATFIGKCNMIGGRARRGGQFERDDGPTMRFGPDSAGEGNTLCFRPERGTLAPRPRSDCNNLGVIVKSVAYLGPFVEYELRSDAGESLLQVTAASAHQPALQPGSTAVLSWRPQDSLFVT